MDTSSISHFFLYICNIKGQHCDIKIIANMIDIEFDDLYYVENADYDDTIISDDPFAEAFGTPDMYRPDTSRRYTEEELGDYCRMLLSVSTGDSFRRKAEPSGVSGLLHFSLLKRILLKFLQT